MSHYPSDLCPKNSSTLDLVQPQTSSVMHIICMPQIKFIRHIRKIQTKKIQLIKNVYIKSILIQEIEIYDIYLTLQSVTRSIT